MAQARSIYRPPGFARERSSRRDQDEIGRQSVQVAAGIKRNHCASAPPPIQKFYRTDRYSWDKLPEGDIERQFAAMLRAIADGV
jgi:hypothetical protein